MTTPTHPLPATGGSFIRNPDGSLTPVGNQTATDAAAPEAPEPDPQPAVKRALKAPAKEG